MSGTTGVGAGAVCAVPWRFCKSVVIPLLRPISNAAKKAARITQLMITSAL